ncbi:MAG: trypsin-like peptidase domain-containing protein [Flavobacteriaceae bacterium]
MFVNPIKEVTKFTRPLQTITRAYGNKHITPGLSTLFFVNEMGTAVTCKHVSQLIIASDQLNKRFIDFKAEVAKLPRDHTFKRNLKGLEIKYKYKKDTTVQIKNSFMGAVDRFDEITVKQHPKYDLAIVQLKGFNEIKYEGFARFLKDTSKIEQGKYLCRLGFPFPEFNNFLYDETQDDIQFDPSKRAMVPIFPIDGIVTRNIAENNELMGIEMSTPGLRGQSGGPLFDENGIVYGMQQSTKHLHLGFDIEDKELLVKGELKKINDYAFLHLGQCIRVDIIKDFLTQNQVKFYEE